MPSLVVRTLSYTRWEKLTGKTQQRVALWGGDESIAIKKMSGNLSGWQRRFWEPIQIGTEVYFFNKRSFEKLKDRRTEGSESLTRAVLQTIRQLEEQVVKMALVFEAATGKRADREKLKKTLQFMLSHSVSEKKTYRRTGDSTLPYTVKAIDGGKWVVIFNRKKDKVYQRGRSKKACFALLCDLTDRESPFVPVARISSRSVEFSYPKSGVGQKEEWPQWYQEYHLRKIEAEVAMAKKLDHPSFVPIIRTLGKYQSKKGIENVPEFKVEKLDYLVPWRTQDLLAYLDTRKGNLQEKEIMKQLLEGLVYLAQNRLIHRDIKAENILIHRRNGQVVAQFCDYGDMCSMEEKLRLDERVGTPCLLPPEAGTMFPNTFVYNKTYKAAPSTDVYCLGIAFKELHKGNIPQGPVGELIRGMIERGKENRWTAERCLDFFKNNIL